jgi:hypothetical protein
MIPSLTSISEPNTYEPLENNPILNELKENIKNLPEREI